MIKIPKEVLDLVPIEMRTLDDSVDYKLTKTESTRPNRSVGNGTSIFGSVRIVNRGGMPCLLVEESVSRYLVTSGILQVIDVTNDTVTFRTEGGVYKLERLEE